MQISTEARIIYSTAMQAGKAAASKARSLSAAYAASTEACRAAFAQHPQLKDEFVALAEKANWAKPADKAAMLDAILN